MVKNSVHFLGPVHRSRMSLPNAYSMQYGWYKTKENPEGQDGGASDDQRLLVHVLVIVTDLIGSSCRREEQDSTVDIPDNAEDADANETRCKHSRYLACHLQKHANGYESGDQQPDGHLSVTGHIDIANHQRQDHHSK